jgi:protocatechuate 3,4-dioxygenase beta subunit
MLKRRNILNFLGGLTAVSLVGCVRKSAAIPSLATPPRTGIAPTVATPPIAAQPGCIVRPQQTEGPYFVDEQLNRSDIRSNPADNTVKPGVPLKLTFRVSRVNGAACVPLAGAIVDLWHCDAAGVYSDVRDRGSSTVGQKFLRGYQTTDAKGLATFTTIYPGWYPGRTVHIHFKIRTDGANQSSEFTSQLYFADALTDQVYQQSPYNIRGQRNTRNNRDGIFRDGGEQLLLSLVPAGKGYAATFEIGVAI